MRPVYSTPTDPLRPANFKLHHYPCLWSLTVRCPTRRRELRKRIRQAKIRESVSLAKLSEWTIN